MVQTINNSIEQDFIYTLSIQVSLNGLSFCVLNDQQEITALKKDTFGVQLTPEQVLEKIKYLLDHHHDLHHDFKKIEVIYHNPLYTVVPKVAFNSELLKEYLQYNARLLETDYITYDQLDAHELVTVYVPYTNINNFFFETFGSFTYKHSTSILMHQLLSLQKRKDQVTVFANMHSQSFDLVIIKKGKLLLANTYRHDSKEDFLYYLLFVADQLQLNPEEFILTFLGDIKEDDAYYQLAYRYIRNITFGERVSPYTTAENVVIQPHEHFVLLSNF